VALQIGNSLQSAPLPAPMERNEVMDAARGVQNARAREGQAVQNRVEAQAEMRQAEKRLQQARLEERAADDEMRTAEANQLRARQSQALSARGSIMDIIV